MAYGIGSVIGDIDQKVDTYRNNPEALAQMYQQNQQLIDLLALQKLKTEKEAAMRDMQMKMQTPAASIKDQREQEVMGMMRNEVAQQMGPGLQVAGQQAAQAAAPPAPQGGGLPSLPAPNMQSMGMAEGGIVAFAGERGSYVSQEAYRRQKAKERAEKERRELEASAAKLEAAQGTAELPYSPESILQDIMSRANRPTSTGREDVAPVDPGPGSVAPEVSMEALRGVDERRANEASAADLEAAYREQLNADTWKGVVESAQEQGKSPAVVADYLGATPIGRMWDRESEAGQRIMDKDAIREQLINQYGLDAGVFGLFRKQSDEQREQAKQIMRALPTLSFADALAVAATGKLPAAKEISDTKNEVNVAPVLGENDTATKEMSERMGQTQDDIAALTAMTSGAQTTPQAALPTTTPPTTPDATAGISTLPRNQTPPAGVELTEEGLKAVLNIPSEEPSEAVKQAPPEVQNEYTRRLSELRGEQESKLDALIAFMRGAGGKTSFAATMSGGAAGMNAREQQIENEIMATVDKIEGLKLEERKMGVQERQVSATEAANRAQERFNYANLGSQEREGAADRGARERQLEVQLEVQKEIARYGRISDEKIAEMRVKSEAAQRAAVTQDTLTRAQYDNLREAYRANTAAAQGLLEVANDYTAGEEARLSASKQLQEFRKTIISLETQLRKPLVGNSTSPPAGTGDLNDPNSWGGLNVTAP